MLGLAAGHFTFHLLVILHRSRLQMAVGALQVNSKDFFHLQMTCWQANLQRLSTVCDDMIGWSVGDSESSDSIRHNRNRCAGICVVHAGAAP